MLPGDITTKSMWYTGSIHLCGQCNYARWTACKALKRVSEVSDLWTSEQLKRSEGRQPTSLPEPGLPKTKSIGVSGPPCTCVQPCNSKGSEWLLGMWPVELSKKNSIRFSMRRERAGKHTLVCQEKYLLALRAIRASSWSNNDDEYSGAPDNDGLGNTPRLRVKMVACSHLVRGSARHCLLTQRVRRHGCKRVRWTDNSRLLTL